MNSEFSLKLIGDQLRTYPIRCALNNQDFRQLEALEEKVISFGVAAEENLNRGKHGVIVELFDDLLDYWYEYVPRYASSFGIDLYPENFYYEPKQLESLRFAEAFRKQYRPTHGKDRESNRNYKEFLMTLSNRLRKLDAGELPLEELKAQIVRVEKWLQLLPF